MKSEIIIIILLDLFVDLEVDKNWKYFIGLFVDIFAQMDQIFLIESKCILVTVRWVANVGE